MYFCDLHGKLSVDGVWLVVFGVWLCAFGEQLRGVLSVAAVGGHACFMHLDQHLWVPKCECS